MSLLGLRTAIVTALDTAMPDLRTCAPHGGKFDVDELRRWARQNPAVLISLLAIPDASQESGQARANVRIAAFVVATGSSIVARDAAALGLVERVVGYVVKDLWAYGDATAPANVRADNLYSGKLDKQGVALWAVSWTQQVDVATVDASAFDDLNTVNSKIFLPPYDGVFDTDATLQLQGTYMSAYGHIYVSASTGTLIAASDTYQKLLGTTTLKLYDEFDMPSDGRLRHTGTVARPVMVTAAASITVGGDAKVTLALAKNGVVDEDTEIEEEMTLAGGVESFAPRGVFSLDANDYVEVWVKADSTVTVTATKLNLVAAAT